ncbi:hypothetical protein [Aminobacter sp. LjRoot7]|uniref:hypothetical protein n=1 Tax=Aminobacter sp. LjRoot7 TaxID=3342335 RepID=UPI003ECC4817
MNRIEWLGFVLSGCLFAAIFLVGIIVYGGGHARNIALTAALFACMSQFAGQDQRLYRPSIFLAYAAFGAALWALFAIIQGR